MSGEVLGYVVVEWDGDHPIIEEGSLYSPTELGFAHEIRQSLQSEADDQQAKAGTRGSKIRYTVHKVMAEEIKETGDEC